MTRYSKTMSEALQEVSERASAKRDAMKAMGKNKGIDPADVDTDATDDDVKAASKNIIMQLRKSVSMRGNHNVEFASGKQKVDAKIAQAVQDKFNKIKRPADKQDFQNKIAKSYKDLLLALKEQYEMVEVKEEYVCEDCGCEQGNADPNCSCPNDSTDLQASYWVKKESVDEGFELEEGMKMNDPKLLKMFDKLKKGSKIKLKTSSTISQGKDYVEYIVKSKNLVNKGRVEKITLATVGNEKAVKKFLYKRDGTVGFAIGDMGASIDDIKEDFTPHMMYDPKTGKGYKAEKEADHLRMKDMGYTHEKPDMDESSLNELREPYTVIDTADGNKVVGMASDEKGAKSIITTSELPPMKIKDKKTLKIVKVKKKQMIGQPIKEEEEPQKPDSAKEVEQGREDKKKTRIAQLQLQIAKATETINKLNTEEK